MSLVARTHENAPKKKAFPAILACLQAKFCTQYKPSFFGQRDDGTYKKDANKTELQNLTYSDTSYCRVSIGRINTGRVNT